MHAVGKVWTEYCIVTVLSIIIPLCGVAGLLTNINPQGFVISKPSRPNKLRKIGLNYVRTLLRLNKNLLVLIKKCIVQVKQKF